VPPCALYGVACLVIRDAMGCVRCSDEWEIGVVTRPGSHGARGDVVPRLPQETLAMQEGLWYRDYPRKLLIRWYGLDGNGLVLV
jgi:hypothetical protein